jgi:DNA-binding MarR family transcriptional regulator
VDRTSIGDLLDGLEERGFVERRRSPEDRRRNVVVLTSLGESTFETAERIRLEIEREFLAPLPDRERFREDLGRLLGE